jgi:FkbM family methyltransferase
VERYSSRLIVDQTAQQGLVAFFDSVKLLSDPTTSIPRWELTGICYRPGMRLEALELRYDDIVLPSVPKLWLPSPGIGSQYSQFPESSFACCRISFAANIAQEHPWLMLHAYFSDGEGRHAALIHLIENERARVSAPFISTVRYGKECFRFYVENADDEIQGRHHARGLFYESGVLEYIRDTCPKELMVVDVGANVGNHAVYLDKVFGAREVVVFEPNQVASAILLKNIALNDCRNINTRYLKFGVSDGAGRYRIGETPHNNLGGTTLVEDSGGPIATVRLDDVLRCFRVGMIKIDVEGMEMPVLRGATKLIASAAPVIAIEVTPESINEVRSFFDGFGYRIERTFSMYVDIATLIAVPARIFPRG